MGSISEKSNAVKAGFRDLIALMQDVESHTSIPVSATAVSDILERFSLWAGNLGAMRLPLSKLSLDRRLVGAPEIREQIGLQLDDLREAVDDREIPPLHSCYLQSSAYLKIIVSGIIRGDNPNRDIGDSDASSEVEHPTDDTDGIMVEDKCPSDEAHMIVDLMSECIKSLFRIAIIVRKTGACDRFKRALQMSDSEFPPTFDVDYVLQTYPKVSKAHAKNLPERLGSAIAKRRQFIKYSRDHRARLGAEEVDDTVTERQSSKATTLHTSALRDTSANQAEEDAMSFMSVSTMADSLYQLQLPQLADLSPELDPFECPICFTMQSFEREKNWR